MIDSIISHLRLAARPEGRVFDRRSASAARPSGLAAKRVRFTATVAPAFTLVELMISIALVVLLILGINTVFKYTAQAVGQGQAINTAVRDSRSAQTTMANDFAALVPNGTGATDSASLIIASSATPAYMNAADKAAADGETNLSTPPTTSATPLYVDINGDGKKGDTSVPGEVISPATYNFRNHRLDTLSFFARNSFPRQTGNDGTYVDNMSSQEAWVWYGHLWLPTNDQSSQTNAFPVGTNALASTTYPGAGTVAQNPNNIYASQFVLGRAATLLQMPNTANAMSDGSVYIQQNPAQYPAPTAAQLQVMYLNPLQYQLKASSSLQDRFVPTSNYNYSLEQSRLDLAGTSIKTLQSHVALALANLDFTWWIQSTYATTTNAQINTTPLLRFQANPFLSKPLTAAKIASASPYFVPGCSQFIVEYAGDFLTQDNDPSHQDTGSGTHSVMGKVTAFGGDGTLDYVMVPPIGNPAAPPSQCTKQIMWYGMPRNTSGRATTNWQNGDTAPVRDILYYDSQVAATGANAFLPMPANSFEKFSPPTGTNIPVYKADYTASGGSGMSEADALSGYIAAFGPNDPAPSLIRITMTLNDAAGQLPDGQTYQFVFAVAPQ